MSEDTFEVVWHGCDGSTWHVAGGELDGDEGVILVPKVTKLIDAPVRTLWVKGPFGSKYQGHRVMRRDPVLGFQIYGADPESWELIDSRFRQSWDYDREGFLEYRTALDSRRLGLRLLEEPRAYEGDTSAGRDPHLTHDSLFTVSAAAENPYWVGGKKTIEFELPSTSGTVEDVFFLENTGDVEVWPYWTLSSIDGGAVYTLPDPSFGSEEHGRGVADAGRVVPVPELIEGEHVTAMSHPDEEYLVSTLDTNPWARTGGKELIYPVPPRTSRTFVPFTWSGASVGDRVRLSWVCQYSRPWGFSV